MTCNRATAKRPANIVRIGHPAYRGDNAMKYCNSKAAAVRELRSRGVKRDAARAAVNDVCSRLGGYTTIRASEYSDVIEIGNYTGDYRAL